MTHRTPKKTQRDAAEDDEPVPEFQVPLPEEPTPEPTEFPEPEDAESEVEEFSK